MTNENNIQIGDNLCFVAKDKFSYKTVAITIQDDKDLERIGDFFNSKNFVQAFRADSIREAIQLAQKSIVKKQKERLDNLGEIHKDIPEMENASGFNSFITDSRKPGQIIQAVPK